MSDDLVKRLRRADTCIFPTERECCYCGEAADRILELEAALRHVMAGGNHVALLIGADHPPYTTTHDKALTHYGAGYAYDAWCCWKAIMEARKALEGKDG